MHVTTRRPAIRGRLQRLSGRRALVTRIVAVTIVCAVAQLVFTPSALPVTPHLAVRLLSSVSPDSPTFSNIDISSISPSTVTAGGGTTVTISGSGFTSVSAVLFGPNASSDFTVISQSTIVAVAPIGVGAVQVTVQAQGGRNANGSSSRLTYEPTGQVPITKVGNQLRLNGVAAQFSGVNAYEIASDYGVNGGCGTMETPTQLQSFFSSLAPRSIVRFDAFQGSMAINYNTHVLDWAPLDQIFYLAARYQVYLLPVITGQGAGCDGGHWQDPAWYNGGYTAVYNSSSNSDGQGLDPLSYWSYMTDLVNRYKDSPALAMWEPISEPTASTCPAVDQPGNCADNQTCPNEPAASAALLSFYDVVGAEIHSLDPRHLVEDGSIDGGQCGTVGSDFENVARSSGIDVLSIHYYPSVESGPQEWSSFDSRFEQELAVGKPVIGGEIGVVAASNGDSSCDTLSERASDIGNEMTHQFAEGVAAFLLWNWDPGVATSCSNSVGPNDPAMAEFESH